MIAVKVRKTLNAPIERVFDILTDHAGYSRFRGVNASELLKEGAADRNGLGAQRRLRIGQVTVVEDIVGYRRPELMEYRITRIRPPIIDHKIGRIQLKDAGDGRTEVTWTSEGRVTIPVLGRFLESRIAAQFESGFHGMLNDIERLAK